MSRRTADTEFWEADGDSRESPRPGTSTRGHMERTPQICTSRPVGEGAPPRADREVGAPDRPGPRHPISGDRNKMVSEAGRDGSQSETTRPLASQGRSARSTSRSSSYCTGTEPEGDRSDAERTVPKLKSVVVPLGDRSQDAAILEGRSGHMGRDLPIRPARARPVARRRDRPDLRWRQTKAGAAALVASSSPPGRRAHTAASRLSDLSLIHI